MGGTEPSLLTPSREASFTTISSASGSIPQPSPAIRGGMPGDDVNKEQLCQHYHVYQPYSGWNRADEERTRLGLYDDRHAGHSASDLEPPYPLAAQAGE